MRTSHIAVPVICVVIMLAIWYKLDQDIDALRVSQRQMTEDIGALGKKPVIDVSKAPFLGPAEARVTLIEYSDYECPFCIRHTRQTMPQIAANFIDTGRIRYVFKDFPIDQLHPDAIRAHEAGRCAAGQNKFWELHKLLFSAPGTHTRELLEQRATEAGLNLTTFRACLSLGQIKSEIQTTVDEAARLGANGTPAFFVGVRDPATGQVRVAHAISGAQPYSVFENVLNQVIEENK
jgi:protein-disulfide isomerase